jgi:alanine racemase
MDALGRLEIDLAALARNYRVLADATAPGTCGAVVKADAYGLGVGPVARCLHDAGCRHFFVATPAEGMELRGHLVEDEIFVFSGLQGAGNDELLASSLQPVLNTRAEMRRWGSAGPAAVHIDTGMSRLGLTADDIGALELEADRVPAVDVRYVLTHLACADEPDHPLNRAQLEAFDRLRSLWPAARTSIGNSAGLLLGREFQGDLARPGIALYGGNPFRRAPSAVEPVVTLKGRILQLRDIAPGTAVGYGASFVAGDAMRVATVGIGYADGYFRSLGNCGIAEISRRRVPLVGRVSMDLICFDVTAIPRDEVAEGDWATLIGGSIALEEVAALAGTINYEVLTALGDRYERVYLDDGLRPKEHQ